MITFRMPLYFLRKDKGFYFVSGHQGGMPGMTGMPTVVLVPYLAKMAGQTILGKMHPQIPTLCRDFCRDSHVRDGRRSLSRHFVVRNVASIGFWAHQPFAYGTLPDLPPCSWHGLLDCSLTA